MKTKKTIRIASLLLAVTLLLALFGCGKEQEQPNGSEGNRLSVVCTLFPQYDFVRQIAGDKVDSTLLLTPGADSHTYDPSPADMVRISQCSLFIYTGDLMELWAANVIKSLDKNNVTVLDLSEGIALSAVEHEDEHDHEHEAEENEHSVDPHIWTSPKNAAIMARSIGDTLKKLDPTNAAYYEANTKDYCDKLDRLDAEIRAAVDSAPLKEIVVCDRFAMHYFCQEYGLTYLAAFDSCTSETEPSPAMLAKITEHVKANRIPAVFYAELSNQNLAQKVASLTDVKTLELHSCHNLSAEQFSRGVTYLDLMEQNLNNLKIALGNS